MINGDYKDSSSWTCSTAIWILRVGTAIPARSRDCKNTRMYSFVRDRGVGGTYLLIEEGKLYATSANQYIRTTQKRDRIDLVERTIQLSNDTDRFCDRNGNVTAVGSPDWADAGWSANIPNPVEACGNCSSSANIQATCIDEDPAGDGTQPPVIYARSRVADLHGRKWITNTSGDDYVDFVTPRYRNLREGEERKTRSKKQEVRSKKRKKDDGKSEHKRQ